MNAEPHRRNVAPLEPKSRGRLKPAFCLLTLLLAVSPRSQATNSPMLSVRFEDRTVVVSWPANATNHLLYQTTDLSLWTASPAIPRLSESCFEARFEVSTNTLFFRLRNQAAETIPQAIGVVIRPDGQPVANALVGHRMRTDRNGVWSGSPLAGPAGWVRIDAQGFATAFTKPAGRSGRARVSEAWLTPFRAFAPCDEGSQVKLFLGGRSASQVEVALSQAILPIGARFAGLADLDPKDIGPISAPLEPRQNLFLERAFCLQVMDTNFITLDAPLKSPVMVIVRDNKGTNPPPILARFDETNGFWEVLPGACSRLEPGVLACAITRCAPLHGLFAPARVAPRRVLGGDAAYEDYRSSRKRFDERARQLDDLLNSGGTVDPSLDNELNEALNEMAAAAAAYAAGHPDESGKLRLGRVAEQAYLLGRNGLAESLMAQARGIAEDIARANLDAADCGRVLEMVHAMEQLILLAGSPALEQALRDKIERLYSECDLWVGSINYFYWISSKHVALDNFTLFSGGGCWREEHSVRMATHAKTLILKGESLVKHSFPLVEYQDSEADCLQSISFYGQPAYATLELRWDGAFNGLDFNVGAARPASSSTLVNLVQHQIMEALDSDDNCVIVRGYPLTLHYPNYSSVLVHGFLDSPPITLQEMLDGVPPGPYPEGTIIRGSEELGNPFPQPNLGRYPFTRGSVFWSFHHVKSLLPLNP